MQFTSFTLPDIKDSDLNSEKERRQILEYLYQLTEQLRFVLTNIDEENLSAELAGKIDNNDAINTLSGEIKDAYGNIASLARTSKDLTSRISTAEGNISTLTQTAISLTSRISTAEGNISTIDQYAHSLTLSVSNGTDNSIIKLMAGSVQIASQTIKFTGNIIFASNLTDGVTQINGGNILTGTVAAARIDVDNLYVKHLSSQGANFVSLDAVNGLCHLGGDYIRVNGVEFGYVKGTYQVSVVPSYSGGYGNVGVGDYYWDQVKADKLYYISFCRQWSARKYKTDILDITDDDIGNIDSLSLVSFIVKADKTQTRQPGVLADNLYSVFPLAVSLDDDGEPDSVDYSKLCVLALYEIKKLRARVRQLEETA